MAGGRGLAAVLAHLSILAWLLTQAAAGPVTYVDAVGGIGGNTVRASNGSPDDWFVVNATGADGLWNFRDNQGHNGIFQSVDSSTAPDDVPELVTTATGLANALYDVYVFFRSQAGADDWNVRAGFTSNPNGNPLYARTSAGGATAGALALSGPTALTWDGLPPQEDSGQPLYYALIGQYNVTDGTLSVYIDDLPSTGANPLNTRTWYEGIGYALPTTIAEINSVMSGPASSAATWSDNQPPGSGKNYNVLNSHTVSVASAFAGDRLTVKSGGAVDISGNQVDIRYLKVDAGGSLTESVSGDFTLGDPFAAVTLGFLETDQDLTFNMDAGSDFTLAMSLLGTGNLDFNSNGPGSELILPDVQGHQGVIRFNGTGDGVRLVTNRSFRRVEMNSTGANAFIFNTTDQLGGGVLVFNQPGIVDHASTVSGSRLIQSSVLEANAPVTVDLTKTFINDERRLSYTDAIRGAADITVNGTATDPYDPAGNTNGTTLNEFELGSTGEPSGAIPNNSYTGTLTANNYVNVELRHSMTGAKVVVNNHALLDMGHQVVGTAKAIQLGEVVIANGGTLEVGFTQSIANQGTGHHVSHLELVASSGRTGSLTLADGSTTVMQVNGIGANEFDTISAEGTIALDGTLKILVNPESTNATANPTYTPTLGDTITLMTAGGGSLPTDFDDNGSVGASDLTTWKAAFGATAAGDADGDGDTDGADFLAWQRDLGKTSGGGITGMFDSLEVVDPGNFLAGAGLAFQLQVTPSAVNLVVVSASAVASVPEPVSIGLGGWALIALCLAERRR